MSTADKLSPKQARALRAIVDFHAAKGFAPTRSDVGRALDPTAKRAENVVRGTIESLIMKGFLSAIHGSGRSMRPTEAGEAALAAHEREAEAAAAAAAAQSKAAVA